MDKQTEIKTLQSLKGDTYFGQLFNDGQIDQMCENITKDYPIEFGLNLDGGKCSELENRLQSQQELCKEVAKDLLREEAELEEEQLGLLAERLIGFRSKVRIKLEEGLSLTQTERAYVCNLIPK